MPSGRGAAGARIRPCHEPSDGEMAKWGEDPNR